MWINFKAPHRLIFLLFYKLTSFQITISLKKLHLDHLHNQYQILCFKNGVSKLDNHGGTNLLPRSQLHQIYQLLNPLHRSTQLPDLPKLELNSTNANTMERSTLQKHLFNYFSQLFHMLTRLFVLQLLIHLNSTLTHFSNRGQEHLKRMQIKSPLYLMI
jgi:hypothetical protein